MTEDHPEHATPAQFEAARRFFARRHRPADRWEAWRAAETEEQHQDNRWESKGGNA